MKITNKIIAAGTALLAAAVLFAGCTPTFGKVKIDANDPNKSATVDYTNEENDIARGWNSTNLKHSSANAIITINNQKTNSEDGVMGIAWQMVKNKVDGEELYSFYIVGVRNYNGKIGYYVSRVENCPEEDLGNGKGFGGETQIAPKKGNGTYVELGDTSRYLDSETGNVVIGIKITPKIGTKSKEEDKVYPVTFDVEIGKPDLSETSKVDDSLELKFVSDLTTKTVEGVSGLDYVTAKKSAGEDEKLSSVAQNNLAYYASVYGGKTLTGSWQLCGIVNADEVVED